MAAPMRSRALLPCAAALLAGCGAFNRSPVIEERVSDFGIPKIGVLATTGERRAVIVKMPERLICAEPLGLTAAPPACAASSSRPVRARSATPQPPVLFENGSTSS